MLVLGDIASPNEATTVALKRSLIENSEVFSGQDLVVNLEGLLADHTTNTETPVLFNHPDMVDCMLASNTRLVTLANNHTLDLPEQFKTTSEELIDAGIAYCGAGYSFDEAASARRVTLGGKEYSFFGHCWNVMLQHQKNPSLGIYVASDYEINLLNRIREERKRNRDNIIVVLPHWNLDLELYPFPIHRTLAKRMIDSGANAVFGSHSHCVQGGERHGDGIIVYGLGNFFIPWKQFQSGKLTYPEFTRISLAIQWVPETGEAVCHWFDYNYSNGDHILSYTGKEDFDSGERINSYSSFRNRSQSEYIKFYRQHRVKRNLIPVYKNVENSNLNRLFDFYMRKRIRLARSMATSGLRKWKK